MNRKYFSDGKWQKCSEDGCLENAAVRGLCKKHYRIMHHYEVYVRTEKPKSYKAKNRQNCKSDGCSTLTTRVYCSKHLAQFNECGFTWDVRPTKEIKAMRESLREPCTIRNCGNTSMQNRNLCNHHFSSSKRKGLTPKAFISMMEIDICEACGFQGDLVIDHRHGHHTKDNQMCQECIRGRICNPCNTSLGLLENESRVVMLKNYLSNYA